MNGSGGSASDRSGEIAGVPLFWREAQPAGGTPPTLYVHGSPTNSDDFLSFLERTGGFAPDLPGFGRSGKPADFDYSIPGYVRLLERYIDAVVTTERFALVVHDWGALALTLSDEYLERLERVVVINAVPLFSDYRWHRVARLWRTPVVGELTMGFSTRWGFKRLSRDAVATDGRAPDYLIDRVWDHFDHGTQRAILKLYRSGPPEVLGRAGARLGAITCPGLVLWGRLDPYIPESFAAAYSGALGGPTRLELVEEASHWPWIDRPEAVTTVTDFLVEG